MMLRTLILSVWLVAAFTMPTIAQQKSQPDEKALKEWQQNDAKYNEARNKKDIDGVMAFYADDATMVSPFGILVGKDKIKNWYVGVLKTTSEVVVKTDQVYTQGPLSWGYGHWTANATQNGEKLARSGTWATVHQGGKVVLDSWNRAAETAPMPATGSSTPPPPSSTK
jgi:ketosteroid isomerase-like protein